MYSVCNRLIMLYILNLDMLPFAVSVKKKQLKLNQSF